MWTLPKTPNPNLDYAYKIVFYYPPPNKNLFENFKKCERNRIVYTFLLFTKILLQENYKFPISALELTCLLLLCLQPDLLLVLLHRPKLVLQLLQKALLLWRESWLILQVLQRL